MAVQLKTKIVIDDGNIIFDCNFCSCYYVSGEPQQYNVELHSSISFCCLILYLHTIYA
jgi:hypothetical protein